MKNTGKKRKKRRIFRHINQNDRDRIEALLDAGHDQEQIATILQFDPGAISREINKRKQKNGRYKATVAQHKAGVKRSNSKHQGMKIEKYPNLRTNIIKALKAYHSPDEIAGRMEHDGITPRASTRAIYRWLYSSWGQAYCHLLCTKRYRKKKQKKKTKREMIPDRISLAFRPREGVHAEADLFVSSKASGSSRSGAIIYVPEAKLLVGTMIENKKPAIMAQAMRNMNQKITINDVTMDNGIENRDHQDFGLPTYFCDPHSPWQKPHVEGGIGLLRRWFIKKKTDLTTISEDDLQTYLHILNGKWRKSLGYQSAYEAANERGIMQTKIPNMGIQQPTHQKVAFQVKI